MVGLSRPDLLWRSPHRTAGGSVAAVAAPRPVAVRAALRAEGAQLALKAGALFPGFGGVHLQLALLHGERVEHANRLLRLGLRAHRHEGEALRLARVAVLDQVN